MNGKEVTQSEGNKNQYAKKKNVLVAVEIAMVSKHDSSVNIFIFNNREEQK